MLGPRKSARRPRTEIGLLERVLRHDQQAGIPAHLRYPSSLRHFWATQQVTRGITPAQLQAHGGWRDRRRAQAYFPRPPLAATLGLDHETPAVPYADVAETSTVGYAGPINCLPPG